MADPINLPLVSIVIPVYNGTDYMAEAIDSALAQTWPNTEVIVINDGSDDGGRTAGIAASYGDRIRYFHQPNGGVAAAINTGIREMRGVYFSWLSHDDVYETIKIELQMAEVMRWQQPVLAFSDFSVMDATGKILETRWTGAGFDHRQGLWAIFEGRINGCATLIHRACFEQCGLLLSGLATTQDYDMWFRIGLRFPIVHVPGVVVRHRSHPNQGSKAITRHLSEVSLLWRFMLDRLDDRAVPQLASTQPAFLTRVLRGPFIPGLPGVHRSLARDMGRLTRGQNLSLVIHHPVTRETAAAIAARVDGQSATVRSVIAITAADSDVESEHPEGNRPVPIDLVAANQNGVAALLERADRGPASDFVLLTSGEGMCAADVATSICALLANQEASACLLQYPGDPVLQSPAAVLEGAMFRRGALSLALQQSTGSITSLVHALSRLGQLLRVHATPTIPLARPAVERSELIEPPPQKPGRLVAVLAQLERAPWALGLIWRLLRVLGNKDPDEKLAQLAGVGGWIDSNWYQLVYPDVRASRIQPVIHYLCYGHRENRDPSPLFNTTAYLNNYPDVASSRMNPLRHYALWGRHEGRVANRTEINEPALPKSGDHPTVLLLLHDLGGGVARFAAELAQQVANQLNPVFLCGHGEGTATLGTDERGRWGRTLDLTSDLDTLAFIADRLEVRRIMVLHLMGFEDLLPDLLSKLGRPFDIVNLDYVFVSDNFHLAQPDGRFLGDDRLPEPIWRDDPQRQWLLTQAQTLFACSTDLAQRLARLGIDRTIQVAPPPDPYRLSSFRPWARPIHRDEPLRIALFGIITPSKGLWLLMQLLERVVAEKLPFRFIVFGELRADLPAGLNGVVQVSPTEDATALTRAVVEHDPQLAWFPFLVAETHSYALTDAMAHGLPIAAAAIGAVPDRLADRRLSWLLPPDTPVAEWIDLFLRLLRNGFDDGAIEDSNGDQSVDDKLYQRHLYREILGNPSPAR